MTGRPSSDVYYIDGRFVPADQAVIPVDDLAVLRGFGVFDLIRTFRGRPFLLGDHLVRLIRSAREIGLTLPWTAETLADLVHQTLGRNHHAESNIRIVITGGSSQDFMTPMGQPRLLILVNRAPIPPAQWYTDGVAVITTVTERFKPGVKSINYVPAALALSRARVAGAVEALYVDRRGRVLEGATSNLFAVVQGVLVTPDQDILSGITRQVVLDIAGAFLPVAERSLTMTELVRADEVFITGTNKGVVPVVTVDGQSISTGRPGPVTRKILEAMTARTGIGAAVSPPEPPSG